MLPLPHSSVRPLLWLLVLGWWAPAADAQQQFRLSVPNDPALTSSAVLGERELVVTDAQGTTFRYVREPKFDTPDGQYVGFYNAAAQQPLRWPAAGQGAMLLSDPLGQNWRASTQQVQPVGLPGGPVIRPRPIPPAGPAPGVGRGAPANLRGAGQLVPHGWAGGFAGGPMSVAVGADLRGRLQMATIDATGIVRIFHGSDDGWRYAADLSAPGLVPGAPLALMPDVVPGRTRVLTVDSNGVLLMLSQEQAPLPVAPDILFPPAAPLALSMEDVERRLFIVDSVGRLWDLDCSFAAGQSPRNTVEDQVGVLVPGCPVQVLTTLDPTRGRIVRTLFVTDAHGDILQYQSTLGGWAPRLELAAGFVPGAPVGAAMLDLPNRSRWLYLAVVDWRGQLQLLAGSAVDLRLETLDQGTLPPGAPVIVHNTLEGPLLSAVGVDGVWRVWRPGIAGAWDVASLHAGFAPGSTVIADPLTQGLVAVDVRGRVVPALWRQNAWTCSLCHPTLPLPPRLVSRRIVPNPPLPPANVFLLNGSDEDVVVQVADAAAPANSREVTIPAGGRQPQLFERDAGATIEEVYLVPTPVGGWTEETATYPLPPQPRYSLAVWANRTTYRYVNKNPNKPQGALPDFDLKSHVSLGVLDLPPGDLLQDGQPIDVHLAAMQNRNPGAAGYFAPPSGGPTVVPK